MATAMLHVKYRTPVLATGAPTSQQIPPTMPYRPEAELKRPDLKGEFVCATCQKTFCHAASLNRHRLNFHGGNHVCTICSEVIPPKETVRRHMAVHGYDRIFTCGCCNWAFPDKKELHIHTSSMAKFNQPGSAHVIATTCSASGEGPAIGVFKEPKRIREARAAAKAALQAAAGTNSGAAADATATRQTSPVKKEQSTPTPTLLTGSLPPAGLMPAIGGTELYAQLLAQLMQSGSFAASPWSRGFLANNPLLSNPEMLLSQLAAFPSSQTPTTTVQSAIPAPLTVLDPGTVATVVPSCLPSTGNHSEAQDTESDRVSLTPEAKPTSLDDHRALLQQQYAGGKMSVSPMTSALSIDDYSSPSSHTSSVHSPAFDEKNNNSGSDSGAPHSIASLISPDKRAKDSCSSSSDGSSSPEQRHSPSPALDQRKRRRTINDVVSFLHTKQVKVEDD